MAGGTVRMSADEKRKTILGIYHKTKAVYTEKEIVTLATKAGVNSNTVLDINQSLIDDNLVEKEKIGGSNYFWSFPAKKDRLVQLQYQKTVDEIEQLKTLLADANHKLLDAKRGREDDNDESDDNLNDSDGNNDNAKYLDENDATGNENNNNDENVPPPKKQKNNTNTMNRAMKLQRLEEIRAEKIAIDKEMNELKENDPQLIANLQKEYKLVQEAANRWTDNIFNCKSYLIKKRNMDKKDANKILGITDSFDYPEDKIPK